MPIHPRGRPAERFLFRLTGNWFKAGPPTNCCDSVATIPPRNSSGLPEGDFCDKLLQFFNDLSFFQFGDNLPPTKNLPVFRNHPSGLASDFSKVYRDSERKNGVIRER